MINKEELFYRFGDFKLEPRERRLSNADAPISLTPKVFDTLVLLVEHAGRAVSKDELMRALWPRGYVEEATLSNHIWQIRRALGDTAKNTRFIETLPKLGYRFVAEVVVEGAPVYPARDPAPAAQPNDVPTAPDIMGAMVAEVEPRPPAAPRRTRARRVRLFTTAAMVVVAGAVGWFMMRHPTLDAPVPGDRSVALIGFNNLSQNDKDGWLAPALIEMLGSELGAADHIRVLPYELVRDASQGLAAPLAGGYSRETLSKLRQRLGVDYVVSGSYLVATRPDDPMLRVDILLQNARSGALVVTLSNQGGLSSLTQLATRAGASLRDRLGVSIPNADMAGLMANATPPTTDVARRVGEALDAMERHDAARARDELLEAVAQAPQFAPAYLYLSQAWSAMGFRAKALAAAEQASTRSSDLPQELQLEITAAVHTGSYDWQGAVAAWKSLVTLKPLSTDYRIDEMQAEISLGDFGAAQSTLTELKHVAQADGDPRVTIAAARLALAQNDAAAGETLAAEALSESKARELPGVAADAALSLASARLLLGKYDLASGDVRSAIGIYHAIDNPHGESAARRQLAAIIADQNRVKDAHEEYSRALAIALRIGDAGEVGAIYRNVCALLWIEGDRDGAQAAARQALAVARETGDLPLQAWTLRALASVAADDAATDEVMAQYREVTELNERAHDRGGHVWSLATYADTLRLRGSLDEARAVCERAMTEAAALTDPQFMVISTFSCAAVALDRGETDRSRALFERVETLAAASRNPIFAANTQLMLGQIEFEAARGSEAAGRLRVAARGFAAIEAATGEADADALLAICAAAAGDATERDRALARARTLRATITARQEVYFVDIALAQLDGAATGEAVAQLHELALDAERRHFMTWSLEAKLAQWRILAAQGRPEARRLRTELEKQARDGGFNRILALLVAPSQQPT
jgi:DNA-binding winged helix-turn-helix (wHTH) protein/tetratricopeptide (TPR) repeat protein